MGSLFSTPSTIVIPCPKGVPPFLSEELRSLGFPIIAQSVSSVETLGTLADTQRLNLWLRTANRVLYLLEEFVARDVMELYRRVGTIAWEDIIPVDSYLSVTSTVEHPDIRDARFANLKCKDAVVDRIRTHCGRRPDSGPERRGAVIHLHWKDNLGHIYLDTSGEPLSKRGYRKIPFKAPLMETIAAAVVLASGWTGSNHFLNPMCGSGTFAIEAALLALGRAPGLLRSRFGFMYLKGFDATSWQNMRRAARKAAAKAIPGRIIATDLDPKAITAAGKNAVTAGVDHLIEFTACDFAETTVPEGGGVLVLNPEYGERLGQVKELETVYQGIGDFFKQHCIGYRGFVFTGNLALAKKIRLQPRRRMPFFNSGIECRLLEYDLYPGSRREKYLPENSPT
ncbi:MAG TPA: RNA methyltransferase [Syntrophobacteraceae bacterium]|nr:RNA methyltransferase [Syntrophobacteraceae bacterium]HBZ54928.1 RNA methyltransferase [Syntrophobacteraceae bacterium]